MMSDSVEIKLPKELLELSDLSEEELQQKSIKIWVFDLYSEGKVTQSRAAELLEMPVDEFLDQFYKRHFKRHAGPQSADEGSSDLDVALS